MCPKTGFCSARVVNTAAAIATAVFNDGTAAIGQLLEDMGLPVGDFTSVGLTKIEEEREKGVARKRSVETKKRRKKRRRVRKGVQEDEVDAEGVSYEAGAF